ncbi:MAG: tripartite tricarboxylate transporter substrate binding protein [Pigmentiphaga sp.]|nr:tripartite tricarboxylate transporter substrate binding protein [Pigmentiphaga sp.]
MRHLLAFSWVLAGLALGAGMSAPVAAEDAYPQRAVRIIDAYPPGGGTDVLARVLGQELATRLGQPFVVENRPGAAGNIGTDHVAKSQPDGYTLGLAPNQTVAVNPVLYARLPFDAAKDLTGIAKLARLPMVLVVPSSSPVKSVADLIATAKAKPDELTYASAGAGSPHHMAAAVFQKLTDSRMMHIPYKGSAPALVDVLSGTVDLIFCPLNSALPYIQDGRLRALGVTSPARLETLPDTPAIGEEVPGFESDIWMGLVAPAGTPPNVIATLNRELQRILAQPEIQQKLSGQGFVVDPATTEDFNRLMVEDRQRWAEVIKAAGITVD